MDETVIAGSPTPAFVEKFKRAAELYAQYCKIDSSSTRQRLATIAVNLAGFLELEPNQQMLVMKVMGYHGTDSVFDQLNIINSAWNLYNNT